MYLQLLHEVGHVKYYRPDTVRPRGISSSTGPFYCVAILPVSRGVIGSCLSPPTPELSAAREAARWQ